MMDATAAKAAAAASEPTLIAEVTILFNFSKAGVVLSLNRIAEIEQWAAVPIDLYKVYLHLE